jgi:signal transduction histidine kinase/pSer/pThr/pTyr-binding forkhead associated (FHA) protein
VATLFVIRGADEGKRFEMSDAVMGIGRDATNSIRLHDTEVSRRHAEFRPLEGGFALVDLSSSNGTFVNNQTITQTILKSGDHIQIGQTILVFTASPGPKSDVEDLANKISMISRNDAEIPSAIIKAVNEGEGSRLLANPQQATGPWLKNSLANLSVMYQTTQAVSHILDIDQLLDRIMDLIFQSIEADRGCIMLRVAPPSPAPGGTGGGDQFQPKAVRWREGIDTQERIAISRTIMDHVLKEGQGVLISDASHDERFGPAQSIVRFGIRDAICVPMKGRHETLGVLYLDTHTGPKQIIARGTPSGKFTEDHLMLAIAIGHQAALALEETRYYQAMVNAERLAAIGQTIAALSHHIKNILQGLKSGSELLRMGINDKNETLLTQGWKIVEKNQGRIYELVMDMLSYSKEREPALEPTDLNGITREVLELVQGRGNDMGLRMQTKLDDKLPLVQIDPEAIHRALLNIIGNALDALEGRENPTLSVSSLLEADGKWVRLAVTDNGVGISPQRLPDLFKPFMSSKGAKGTGLGLAVSRKILREHGGDILVQSQPGKGSRFVLRLPVHSSLHPEQSSPFGQTMIPE